MYTYIHIYIHIYMYTYLHIYIYTYIYADMYIHTCTHICAHIYVHTCAHTHVHTCAHMYAHVQACTHMYICIYIHTCGRIKTYIHCRRGIMVCRPRWPCASHAMVSMVSWHAGRGDRMPAMSWSPWYPGMLAAAAVRQPCHGIHGFLVCWTRQPNASHAIASMVSSYPRPGRR